jgi:hypothetical protein
MALLESLWKWLNSWWQYASYCFDNGLTNHACRPFFTNLALGAAAVGVLFLLWLARKWWRHRQEVRAAWLRELDKEELADLETQNQYVWDGDKAFDAPDKQAGPDRPNVGPPGKS